MSDTFSSAAVLKQRTGLCPRHGEVHAFTVSYHNDATTYRTPDLCGWCYVEAIERMTTHLQPLPEAAAEKEVSAAHGLTKRVLDVVQSGERGEPLPPIREAMDALMTEANDDTR